MKIPISWKLRLAARNQHFPWGRWPSSGIHLKFWFCYGLFDPEDMKIGSSLGFIATQCEFEYEKNEAHSFRALKWLYLISILHFHRQISATSTRQLLHIIIFTEFEPTSYFLSSWKQVFTAPLRAARGGKSHCKKKVFFTT